MSKTIENIAKITAAGLTGRQDETDAGKRSLPLDLRFEFVVGSRTPLDGSPRVALRTMPYHMCCYCPDLPPGAGSRVSIRNGPELDFRGAETMLFIPAGCTHHMTGFGGPRTSVWMHFRTLFFGELDVFSFFRAGPMLIPAGETRPLCRLLEIILDCPRMQNTVQSLQMQLAGLSFSQILLDCAVRGRSLPQPELTPGQERLLPVLARLNRAEVRPELKELAALAHLSVSRFLAVFRREMAVTPGQYFRRTVQARACKLLADRERSIAECAELLGFRDQFEFSRAFRRATGMPPSVYRKQF